MAVSSEQEGKEKVGHTCQSVSVARNMKQSNAEAERWERRGEAKRRACGKNGQREFQQWVKIDSERKDEPTEMKFVNNCIVFKVQEFYVQKYSCVGLSTPKETKQIEQKKGTNSGEESEQRKAKYRM